MSWSSKKNPNVFLSSTKAKYKAITRAAKEAIWYRRFLDDVGHKQANPTVIHCDNQGAIALAENPIFHAHTKHVEVHHHFIREAMERKEVRLEYIHTNDNISDMLTKPLSAEAQRRHSKSLGLY